MRQRSEAQDRLRWLLHTIDPEFRVPAGALDRRVWLDRLARRLAHPEQSVEVRIARNLVRWCRQLTAEANALEREIALLVADYAPQLLQLKGCGVLIAAKLIG
jgi:transposase